MGRVHGASLGLPSFLLPRLSRPKGIPRPLANHFSLVLRHSRQNMHSKLVCVRVIDSDELDAGVHERGDEGEIARQPVKLGDDRLGLVCFLQAASIEL